jgi:two-component system phosphate regulon sensor histidine kinase PhoR
VKLRLRLARTSHEGRAFTPAALALTLCVATAFLLWFGYQAMRRSSDSARLLLERRVREQLALLWAGVTQDMKGAHATVLVPMSLAPPVLEPPYDLAEAFARGFARFPDPESFFVWRDAGQGDGPTYLFNRADRLPQWHGLERPVDPYPVVVQRDSAVARRFVEEARRLAGYARPSGVFDADVQGVPYQVVVSFQYRADEPERPRGLVGFTVNIDWVRQRYFDELAHQINRIGSVPDDVSLAVLDEARRTVTSTRPHTVQFAAVERSFPLLFADRTLLGSPSRGRAAEYTWTARATAASDSPLAASVVGTDGVFVIMSLSAIAVVVGLLLTLRGVHVAADVARMKSDFVSGVTHDLKTPLTVIRLLADTLARGRYDSKESARDYATQLSRESRNLSALVDHLLAYARLADGHHPYTFDVVDVGELVDDVLGHFQVLLDEQQFAVNLEIAADLPAVWGDRSALIQAMDNLIDNAIKYSDAVRALTIGAEPVGEQVRISVADRGTGIPQGEIERVCEKFSRGRNVRVGGSGLGLAIVRQIVVDHKGRLVIHSESGQGTRVALILPVARTR